MQCSLVNQVNRQQNHAKAPFSIQCLGSGLLIGSKVCKHSVLGL